MTEQPGQNNPPTGMLSPEGAEDDIEGQGPPQ